MSLQWYRSERAWFSQQLFRFWLRKPQPRSFQKLPECVELTASIPFEDMLDRCRLAVTSALALVVMLSVLPALRRRTREMEADPT